jgi:hypothetical protein
MVKSTAALTILALVSTVILAMPYISQVEAGEPTALAKSDRLNIPTECSEQVWPNLAPSCLKGRHSAETVRIVR